METIVMKFPAFPCYFLTLRSKYSTQYPVLAMYTTLNNHNNTIHKKTGFLVFETSIFLKDRKNGRGFHSNLLQILIEWFGRWNNCTLSLSESYWNPVIRVRPLLTKKLLHLSSRMSVKHSTANILFVPSFLAYFNFLYTTVNFIAFLLVHVFLVHTFYFSILSAILRLAPFLSRRNSKGTSKYRPKQILTTEQYTISDAL